MNILKQLRPIVAQSIYPPFSQDVLFLCCHGYEKNKQIMLNCFSNGKHISNIFPSRGSFKDKRR